MTQPVLTPALELGPVQLRVSNLERSLRFYEDIVGLRVTGREGGTVQLSAAAGPVLLQLRELPEGMEKPKRGVSGLYHFAILLPDRAGLGLVLRNLLESGVSVGQGDHLVSEALYIQDPDDNGIELYRDRPRDTWRRDAQGHYVMTTDAVDGEALLAAAEGSTWEGLPSGTTIGHVHFHVGNLQQAAEYYTGILGFELTALYGGAATFLSAGGYHHHIGLNVWAGEGAPAASPMAPGIDYFTIVLPEQAQVEEVLGRIRQAGYDVGEADGAPMVKDRWGIGARFTVREMPDAGSGQ